MDLEGCTGQLLSAWAQQCLMRDPACCTLLSFNESIDHMQNLIADNLQKTRLPEATSTSTVQFPNVEAAWVA